MGRHIGIGAAIAVTAMMMAVEAVSAGPSYQLVINGGPVGPGEEVTVRLVPRVSGRMSWGVASGGGFFARPGVYHAAMRIDTDRAIVGVSVSLPDGRFSVQSEIALRRGAVPGYSECLGPGQAAPPGLGEYVRCDELPEIIERSAVDYPPSARARAREDTIPVIAFVCVTGRVLDAYVPASYRDRGGEPVERDPKLVDAAMEAVRRYRFDPCRTAGVPAAVWVTTVVPFSLK